MQNAAEAARYESRDNHSSPFFLSLIIISASLVSSVIYYLILSSRWFTFLFPESSKLPPPSFSIFFITTNAPFCYPLILFKMPCYFPSLIHYNPSFLVFLNPKGYLLFCLPAIGDRQPCHLRRRNYKTPALSVILMRFGQFIIVQISIEWRNFPRWNVELIC